MRSTQSLTEEPERLCQKCAFSKLSLSGKPKRDEMSCERSLNHSGWDKNINTKAYCRQDDETLEASECTPSQLTDTMVKGAGTGMAISTGTGRKVLTTA